MNTAAQTVATGADLAAARHREDVTRERYGCGPGPLAIAHRGGMALAPENTLAAFERTTALGVRYLETDVHTTRDGHLLCFHDRSLRRVTGHDARVAEVDLAWTRRLRVHGTEPVPTLAEAMHAFPDACFAVDLKDPGSVGAMALMLRTNPGWADRLCVASPWARWVLRLQAEVPAVTTALGWRSLTTLVACSHSRTRPPAEVARGTFAHLPYRLGRFPVYAERVVAQAHDLGLRVNVWTVNDAPTMQVLLDAGVDGIITDRPDLLRDVLVGRGQWAHRGAPAGVPT